MAAWAGGRSLCSDGEAVSDTACSSGVTTRGGGMEVGAGTSAQEDLPMELRVTRARRVYSDGKHNAFTGITALGGRTLIAFRSGRTHVTYDGTIKVIAAAAAGDFSVVTEQVWDGTDLRDPKLTTFNDAAMLYCGGRAEGSPLRSFVAVSSDGESFGELTPLEGIPEGYWLWSVKPCDGTLYGAAYATGERERVVSLVSSADGVHWEMGADFPVPGNEVGLDFDPQGRLWALVREDWQGCVPTLCVADPPYRSFSSATRLPVRLQGPMLKRLEGACVITGRRWDNPGRRNLRTDLFVLEDGHDLAFVRSLPSGGDTSYAGWLDVGPGLGLISYYSSHEHKMDIGWADEAASSDSAHAEHSTPADIFLAEVAYRPA